MFCPLIEIRHMNISFVTVIIVSFVKQRIESLVKK